MTLLLYRIFLKNDILYILYMVDLDLVEFNRWVDGYVNFERRPETRMSRLKTMQILAKALGHPERSCPCFHVTGSKGKGTIAAFIAGILREARYTTGVLASPHVLHFTERVGTGAGPFSQKVYDKAFEELRTAVEKLIADGALKKENVGWFELTTMFAMLCFRTAGVDYAVYEVGMGGRLDATNIVEPVACAFGPVELEHTRSLGNTLAKIASEKAGIIKPSVPCVSAPQVDEVRAVLEKTALTLDTHVELVDNLGNYIDQDFAVAKRTVECGIPSIVIKEKNMTKVKADTSLPARFEKITDVPGVPAVVIDGAHTPSSVRVTIDRLRDEGITGGVLVFGCAEDKNVEEMAEMIVNSGVFAGIFLTRPGDFKKCDFSRMVEAFSEANAKEGLPVKDLFPLEDYKLLLPGALRTCADNSIPMVVMGSMYLAGEAEKIVKKFKKF